ncbi:MAG: lipoate--protein ligase family protein [Chloroflexota bacterium]
MNDREQWRALPYHRGASADHVRLSDALVREAREPALWWHTADRPTLILGPIQTDQAPGSLPVARRQSGGTAVLATPSVLGLDIVLPPRHRLAGRDVVGSYRWLGEVWLEALREFGVHARLVSIPEAREAVPPPAELAAAVRAVCFGTLSPYEVVVRGRKLVGFAQVRRRSGTLLQSGIHLTFDARRYAEIVAAEQAKQLTEELERRAMGLDESSNRELGLADIMRAFERALSTLQGVSLAPADWRAEELARAATTLLR